METLIITLKFCGDRSEARCHYEYKGAQTSKVAWGRNGVEAISKLVKNLRRELRRGTEFMVVDTPIRGKL